MATMEKTPGPIGGQPQLSSPRSSPRLASPGRKTRVQEKEELQCLNDRFAVYIDKMRKLEEQNSRLSYEVTTSKETISREVSSVKTLYETELSNLRKMVDDFAKEKTKLQLENGRLDESVDDLKSNLAKVTAARDKAEDEAKKLDRRLRDKDNTIFGLQNDRKELETKVAELSKENEELKNALDTAKYDLEQSELNRVDLENRLQTASEDLKFKTEMYDKELLDARTQISTIETTREYMETDYVKKYDNLLRDQLQDLRDEFEREGNFAKKELEDSYNNKFKNLKDELSKEKDSLTKVKDLNRDLRSNVEKLTADNKILDTRNHTLQHRNDELDNLRNIDRDHFDAQTRDKDEKIKELKDDIDDLTQDYEDLLGVKIALDLEIATYRKMLEGEEERLNITPPESPYTSPTPGRKRPRMEETPLFPTSTSKGSIRIEECDSDGKFVKLFNSSTTDEPLHGWCVKRQVGNDSVEYKFTARNILKGGASLTIWSSSSGVKHKPPVDLVLKGADWAAGLEAITTVQNAEGEIVAQMTPPPPTDVPDGSRRPKRRARRGDEAAAGEGCIIS